MSVHDDIIREMVDIVDSLEEVESVQAPMVASKAVDRFLRGDESLEVHYLTFEHAKSMARSVLRKRHPSLEEQAKSAAEGQTEMFEADLQDRYSVRRSGENSYVKRPALSLDERQGIHAQLIRISEHYQAHANALAAETRELFGVMID